MSMLLYIIFLEIKTNQDEYSRDFKLPRHKFNWHFTDRSNLNSIAEHGLVSFDTILKQKIKVSRYGASDSSHQQDIQKGLHTCVHLSFIKDHPMYHIAKKDGRLIDPVWSKVTIKF